MQVQELITKVIFNLTQEVVVVVLLIVFFVKYTTLTN